LGINAKTVAKWRKRDSAEDTRMVPKAAHSTVLSIEEEAVIVAFRRHTLLPLDDCLCALQPTIPHLTGSSLHRFLRNFIARLPCRIHTILTDNGTRFTHRKQDKYAGHHIFDRVCDEHGIEHRLTKISHPWTNGQVERMNRTLKKATVRRHHYDSHEQLKSHLSDFVDTYNYARRQKRQTG